MNKKIPSFLPFPDCTEAITERARWAGLDLELLSEITASFRDADYDVAMALFGDALLIRIYNGEEYLFTSPIGLSTPWDMRGAVLAVRDYALREMIPLKFTDVLREELDIYTELFRFVDAVSYDEPDLFFLSVTSECDALTAPPDVKFGRVRLSRIRTEDRESYRILCEDGNVNRYWGYDVRADNPEGDIGYYLETAEREFNTGIAVTLGVYYDESFIGEAVIYSFDMSGGAEIALRLLEEYHGMGLGRETLLALTEAARGIGLLYLTAEVMTENRPSLKMMEKEMKRVSSDAERVYFRLEL